VLTLQHKGFRPAEVRFQAGDPAPRVELAPVLSDETLRTDPPGATVVLDSVPRPDVTPLVVKGWNQGQKHTLTFTKGNLVLAFDLNEGETPGTQVYTLTAPADTRAGAVPKAVDASAPGTLRFSGEFAVRVKLDGKDLGEVREGGTVAAAPGSHRLELSSTRVFFREARTVEVRPGQTLTLPLPGLAHLTVETYPTSAAVLVDGVNTGVESDGSAAITLCKGPHEIGIQGHPSVRKSVNLQGDAPPLRIQL